MTKLILAKDEKFFEDYFKIKCLKTNIFYSGFSNPPVREELEKSFTEKLKSNKYKLFFLARQSHVLSYSQIRFINEKTVEMSYASLVTGQGYGSKVVEETIKFCFENEIDIIILYIAEINIFSIRIAEKNGFTKTGKVELRMLQQLNREILFNEWILRK